MTDAAVYAAIGTAINKAQRGEDAGYAYIDAVRVLSRKLAEVADLRRRLAQVESDRDWLHDMANKHLTRASIAEAALAVQTTRIEAAIVRELKGEPIGGHEGTFSILDDEAQQIARNVVAALSAAADTDKEER